MLADFFNIFMFQLIRSWLILLTFGFLITSCGKKNKSPEETTPDVTPPIADHGLKCEALPPTPKDFGWEDTLTDGNKSVNTFFYNPLNADELVYVVNGDQFGTNKLFKYHIPSKQAVYLASIGNYAPQINKRGWIVYSTLDNVIWKIKVNGDSLTRLTAGEYSFDPKWDHSGTIIYYFQAANGTLDAQLMKVFAKDAGYIISFPQDLANTAAFKKSDKIIYQKIKNNNSVTLILKDMQTSAETQLISGPKESTAGQMNFDNLGLDYKDENFYWSNSNGIFKCELNGLKIDTLFKNCPNQLFENPVLSLTGEELYYVHHIIQPVSPYKLLHVYKSMVFNLLNKQSSELKIFP